MASDRLEGVYRSMLFWIIAVLSVVGVLAMVWVMYLLVRRWL
jgi:hypothetical protein